jgi:hypothetical protein
MRYKMYMQEKSLVNDFVCQLPDSLFSNMGQISISMEFNYNRGKADIIAMTDNGEIIAFEVKLERWRDALHQAYRNTCFAHYSYVVLPEETAQKALQFEAEFRNRSVGLCYMSDGQIVIAQNAKKTDPIQPWLLKKAVTILSGGDTNDERTQ